MTSSDDMDITEALPPTPSTLISKTRTVYPFRRRRITSSDDTTGHFDNTETPVIIDVLPPTHSSDQITNSSQPSANQLMASSSSRLPSADPCFKGTIFHRSISFYDRNITPTPYPNLTLSFSPLPALKYIVGLLVLYVFLAILIHTLNPKGYSGFKTHPIVDTLYFHVVSVCTTGYGDIVPLTTMTKIMSCLLALIGVGILNTLFSSFISCIIDLQKCLLHNAGLRRVASYAFDLNNGQMMIHAYVGCTFIVLTLLVAFGVVGIQFFENLNFIDSLHLAVISVTTIGYGDFSFKTLNGRIFATFWLLLSTFLVGGTYLSLVPTIIKRHNQRSALKRSFTPGNFTLVNMNDEGYIRETDFILHVLWVSGTISEEDIRRCRGKFRELDPCNTGSIALQDYALHV